MDDFLDLFLTMKKAAIAPTTKRDITIPAIAPPLMPDLPPPPLALPEGWPLLPELWFLLGLLAAGVPGGGGGAEPEVHELPPVL